MHEVGKEENGLGKEDEPKGEGGREDGFDLL